jgi:pimeloyl-ACP methyl ester carboxylesterase
MNSQQIAQYPKRPKATTAPTVITEFVKLDDITMYYAEYGAGEPLILLHGGMDSADYWSLQVKDFAQHYRGITPDSRGHGRTTDSDAPLSIHLMAEDIVRLMDYLNLDSALIVGWSFGGVMGLDMAIHHPERVRALVAYAAFTSPDGLKPEVIAFFRNAEPEVLQAEFGDEYKRLSSTPEHLPVLAEQVRTLMLTEPNFTEAELAAIKSPTLVLDGEDDEGVRIDHVKEFAQAIPGAELILMPGTGHYAPIQKAADFNKIVLEFLKDK